MGSFERELLARVKRPTLPALLVESNYEIRPKLVVLYPPPVCADVEKTLLVPVSDLKGPVNSI